MEGTRLPYKDQERKYSTQGQLRQLPAVPRHPARNQHGGGVEGQFLTQRSRPSTPLSSGHLRAPVLLSSSSRPGLLIDEGSLYLVQPRTTLPLPSWNLHAMLSLVYPTSFPSLVLGTVIKSSLPFLNKGVSIKGPLISPTVPVVETAKPKHISLPITPMCILSSPVRVKGLSRNRTIYAITTTL